jgi:uncharacterized membrane protein
MLRCRAGVCGDGGRGMAIKNRAVAAAAMADASSARRRVSAALDVLDRSAPVLVGLLALGYFVLFTAMSIYWRDNLRWGFDSVVDTQPIWNTAHGRVLEVSVYTWTHTRLGQDFTLIEILIAPLYRLLGGNITVILVQTAAIALGGVGVYALARFLMPTIRRSICVLFSVFYLSLLFIHSTNLSQFRSRNTIMWTFFFAWIAYKTGRTWLLWAMFILALLTRSDVSLVIAMFGVYALLERRKWTVSWLPILVGAAWFFVAVYVIVPHFSATGYVYEDHYTWLGGGVTGIVKSTLTRPWFVVQHVLTPPKLRYTFDLLFPFAFLPLLKPRILLIPLPIYLLNMLSSFEPQYTITSHYAALIVPFLMIAALEGVADIVAERGPVGIRLRPFIDRLARRVAWSPTSATATALVGVMLLCSLIQQETTTSWVQSYVLHHAPNPRAADGRALARQVPNDAPLAVTQKIAAFMPDRRYVYFFPGDPLYHSPTLVDRADYIIGDEQLSDFEAEAIARYRNDPAWQVIDERGGFILLRRVQPRGSG